MHWNYMFCTHRSTPNIYDVNRNTFVGDRGSLNPGEESSAVSTGTRGPNWNINISHVFRQMLRSHPTQWRFCHPFSGILYLLSTKNSTLKIFKINVTGPNQTYYYTFYQQKWAKTASALNMDRYLHPSKTMRYKRIHATIATAIWLNGHC